ncbi:MAG: ornithine cyclodeaminase family protein [Paracoccaceae bacterium]|nr:ornithine cyclodeaminase family protein [Paracoccaceae bacterium]
MADWPLTVLSATQVQACLPSTAATLAAIQTAYLAISTDEGRLGPRAYMDAADASAGTFVSMQGIIPSRNLAAVKVIGSFPQNRAHGLPSENGLLSLFDASTGVPLAVMDAGAITAMRTGAVTALGAKYLARKSSRTLAVIGTGPTARSSVRFIADLFQLDEVRVFGRDAAKLALFVASVAAETGVTTHAAAGWQDCVKDADIVVDATMLDQHQPLLKTSWIRPGAVLIVFGIRSSLELDVCTHMDRIVVDDWSRSPPVGPNGALWPQIEAGQFSQDQVDAEIGEIIQGREARQNKDERILFWHRGMVLCDILIASLVLQEARKRTSPSAT